MVDLFDCSEYVLYKYGEVSKLGIRIFDGNGNPIIYAERRGLIRFGKPIYVYTDKYRTKELLRISPPSWWKEFIYSGGFPFFGFVPVSMEYSVTDSITGEFVGSIVHESRQRITRDDWTLISGGKTAGWLKSIRHILHSIIWPRTYEIVTQDGKVVGELKQHRDIYIYRYTMKIEDLCMDTRLLVAAGVVIVALKNLF